MERFRYRRQIEYVRYQLDQIPPLILERLEPFHILYGYDPIFLGLHSFKAASLGRSHRDTDHAYFPPKNAGCPNIVFFDEEDIEYREDTFIHELGHILHKSLHFNAPDIKPLRDYATTNFYEPFACTFCAWMHEDRNEDVWGSNRNYLTQFDPQAKHFFDCLARGYF